MSKNLLNEYYQIISFRLLSQVSIWLKKFGRKMTSCFNIEDLCELMMPSWERCRKTAIVIIFFFYCRSSQGWSGNLLRKSATRTKCQVDLPYTRRSHDHLRMVQGNFDSTLILNGLFSIIGSTCLRFGEITNEFGHGVTLENKFDF